MNDYSPASLPPVTAVEVVDLRGVPPYPVRGYMNVPDLPRVTVRGPAAARIADLWRRLPPGEAARCHDPPFGLRFVADGAVVCQASVCWRCNTIYGDAGGDPIRTSFDAGNEASRALLAELERVSGADAGDEPPAASDPGP